jgi:hypothetical protein
LSEGGQDDDEVSNAIFDDDEEERPVVIEDEEQYDGASESSDAEEEDALSDYDEDGVKRNKKVFDLEEIEAKVTDVKTNSFIDCPENDAFVSAFDKLVSESILERSKDAVKSSSVADISVPYHVRSSNKRKTYGTILHLSLFKIRAGSVSPTLQSLVSKPMGSIRLDHTNEKENPPKELWQDLGVKPSMNRPKLSLLRKWWC